jgi:FkbM family methyltransferase
MRLFRLFKKTFRTFRKEGLTSVFKKGSIIILRPLHRLFFRPYILDKVVDGFNLKFYIGDVIGEEWYGGEYDIEKTPELKWIKEHTKEGDVIIDCGAHHGMFGFLCSKWVGETGKVIGFEALPQNAEIAKKNIELNQIKNFEIRFEALGSVNSMSNLTVSANEVVIEKGGKDLIEVKMVTLDEALSDQNPTFLKIDVEGYEIEVLKGAKRVLSNLPKLDIEIHNNRFGCDPESVKEILQLIHSENYELYFQFESEDVIKQDEKIHNCEYISSFNRVHLFGIPLK